MCLPHICMSQFALLMLISRKLAEKFITCQFLIPLMICTIVYSGMVYKK